MNEGICRNCGHCVAICPVSAIRHPNYAPDRIRSLEGMARPTVDQLEALLRYRRSVRLFKDEPVDRTVIERIISLACLAPSAQNSQSTEFIVVQDRRVLDDITRYTAESAGKVARRLGISPLPVRKIMKNVIGHQYYWLRDMQAAFKRAEERYEEGEDVILHRAPAVIFFHACPKKTMPDVNAQLAIENASLACVALGLGSYYCGFVTQIAGHDKRIGEAIKLPSNHRIYGVLAIGHPAKTFSNWIERTPRSVSWI